MSAAAIRFGDLPGAAARLWADSPAFSFRESRLTFGDLASQVDRAARALLARGVRKGDVVGLWVTNRIEFPIAFFAAMRIGAIVAPMNTRYREHDAAYALKLAECKLLFVVERSGPVDYVEILKAAIPGFDGERFSGAADYPHLRDIVTIGDTPGDTPVSWSRFLAAAERVTTEELETAAAAVAADDIALIVFTSGTTGNPKGVTHDHSIVRNIRERHEKWPVRAGDAVLCFLPMFHLYGMSDNMLAGLLIGTHQVVMDVWDVEEALRLIERERVAGLHGFETHYADLLRAQARRPRDLSSVRFGTLPAGMENSNAVAAQVQPALCPTVSGWGMSEVGCFVFMSSLDDTKEQRCTTSGRPMPGLEVRIADPVTGAEQPPGVEGEILARGYTVMRGYFRDPEATARTIDADGWLHSGDRGFLRPDGFLQFLGRYKEMLKVGGENVSPAALEQELVALVPSIEQVAVVGVPDARLSEVPCAYVVVKQGEQCSLEDVQARCKGKIASFKIPHHVVAVESLPMTASGKVQRVLLRDRALRETGQG
ncbi:MAG TPA: AMP-binding protein [Rhodoblastus sp.]|nr:AMP-binding protein [Rhodoblastus sp.]